MAHLCHLVGADSDGACKRIVVAEVARSILVGGGIVGVGGIHRNFVFGNAVVGEEFYDFPVVLGHLVVEAHEIVARNAVLYGPCHMICLDFAFGQTLDRNLSVAESHVVYTGFDE